MPVVSAALREGLLVRDIRPGIEHAGIGAVVGDTVPLEMTTCPTRYSAREPPPV
jgi:hypothetical protein